MLTSAGIVIIGDEILSGKVEDCNSFFMTKELRSHGIDLHQISVISDNINDISREVKEFSDRFDYVFTSGGIGPTHDDITIEGVASAFNIKPVIDMHLKELLIRRYGENLTQEQLKMALVPEGAVLIKDDSLTFPLIQFKNIYIFPGIPEYLRKKFFAIKKLLKGTPLILKKVYIREYESEIAPMLSEVVKKHTDVKIGSYPVINEKDFFVMITFESLHTDTLNSAINDLLDRVPKDRIMRTEK